MGQPPKTLTARRSGGGTIYTRIGKQYVIHNILTSLRTPPPATVTTLGLTAATQEITSLREENLASARELLSQYLAGTMDFTEKDSSGLRGVEESTGENNSISPQGVEDTPFSRKTR